MSRSAVAFFLLLTGAARSKLAPEFEAAPLTDEEKAKGLTQQAWPPGTFTLCDLSFTHTHTTLPTKRLDFSSKNSWPMLF